MKYSCIYQIRNIIDNKLYIGSATNFSKRKAVHLYQLRRNKHHNIYLQRVYNKHGESNLEFNVLLWCDKENLLIYEQLCLDKFNPEYNECKTAGNTLGCRPSEEVRLKMSLAQKGKHTRPKTLEHKKHLSEAMIGRIPWNKGIPRTVEKKKRYLKGIWD